MTTVIVVIAILAIIAAALVVAAPRMGGTHLGRLGRSRRPLAGDGAEEPRFRGRRRRSYDEHVLLREGEEIQQRVEAQVARDRASTHHRFTLNGRAVADQLAVPHDPLTPGVGAPDHRMADPAYADPRYPDPGYAGPVDEFGRPLTGRSRVEEDSAEEELRIAAARARAANAASVDGGPVGPHGRRRLWSPRPRRGTPPAPRDGRDGRFVP
jgi:hypothetical protein